MAVASETCTQSPTKRKPSVAGFPNGIRPAKRRAAKACQTCRSRKVRCDVVYCDGKPCNNCRLDEVECVVSDSRRKRKPRSDGGAERSPVSVAETEASELKSSSTQNNYTCGQFSPSLYNETLSFNPLTGNSFELQLDHHVPHMLCESASSAFTLTALTATQIRRKTTDQAKKNAFVVFPSIQNSPLLHRE
jgi:Fungal Zn(2)-Cys(6) binuclear cluster domain